jgi:hypothetical protein
MIRHENWSLGLLLCPMIAKLKVLVNIAFQASWFWKAWYVVGIGSTGVLLQSVSIEVVQKGKGPKGNVLNGMWGQLSFHLISEWSKETGIQWTCHLVSYPGGPASPFHENFTHWCVRKPTSQTQSVEWETQNLRWQGPEISLLDQTFFLWMTTLERGETVPEDTTQERRAVLQVELTLPFSGWSPSHQQLQK